VVASVCNIVEALNSGKLRGACLDVLENEKMSQLSAEQESYYEALFQKKNVILTPHIGGWTHESYVKINEVLIDKIKNAWSHVMNI
jgi:D-3-phosphoglycerate dehydrogenase